MNPASTSRHSLSPAFGSISLLAAIFFASAGPTLAGQAEDEKVSGRMLNVRRDKESVAVEQDGQLLMRYRFGNVPRKPYLVELTSPAGVNVLRDAPSDHLHHHGLMFACTANGVDFWTEVAGTGSQVHAQWSPTKIVMVRVGEGPDAEPVEVAILRERLRWQLPDGNVLVEEDRVLTVPMDQPEEPRVITWESTLSVPSAGSPVTLTGTPYHGLGMRFLPTMDPGGHFLNSTGGVAVAGTNEARAGWCAYSANAAPGKPVTVAIFDSPSNSRHPTRWFTMDKGFAYLAASLGVDLEPLRIEPGQRLTLRYGVAVFDGLAAKPELDRAYSRWQQLRQEVRTGNVPGLLGRYFAGAIEGKPAAIRVDRSVAFDWPDGVPDERLPSGPLSVVWQGDLFVDADGNYLFSTDAAGETRVWVDGQPVAGSDTKPGPPVRLEFGFHPIRVAYRSTGEHPRIKLYWRFNQMSDEVISGRYLSHRGRDDPDAETAAVYERGREVVEQAGCACCHAISGIATDVKPGPPLNRTREVGAEYLARWIRNPQEVRPGSGMPRYEMPGGRPIGDDDIAAIAAFLADCPIDAATVKRLAAKNRSRQSSASNLPSGSAHGGSELFGMLGCLACHAPESSDASAPPDPPSLADIGAKWPHSSILRFLEDPLAWHPAGRMPDFRLTEMEASDLAAYLSSFRKLAAGQTLPEPELQRPAPLPSPPELVARGKQLVEQMRCAACHDMEGFATPSASAASLGQVAGDLAARGCLQTAPTGRESGENAPSPLSPRFSLSPDDRRAVIEFLRQRPLQPARVATQELAERVQRDRFLCLRCHTRDGSGGEQLGRAIVMHAGGQTAAGLRLASATPPDLSGVGAKLKPDWILNVLAGKTPNVRPWLTVRMPQFALADATRSAIVDRFVAADAIPEMSDSPPSVPQQPAVAQTLLGSKGFNCQNCHYIGRFRPAADTVGPDLARVGQRVSRQWFMRWLDNPARIRVGTPMPALAVPVSGVADGDLSTQKEIVWNYLSRTPPDQITVQAEAPRVVAVTTPPGTVVQGRVLGDAPLSAVRGVAVGFPNGHSVLFDGGRLAWLGHWQGEFLREVGLHGARHHWVPAGRPVWRTAEVNPPVWFIDRSTGAWYAPASWRDRFGWLDEVGSEPHGVRMRYRLRLPNASGVDGDSGPWLVVTERIDSNPPGDSADGYMRRIEIRGLPSQFDAAVPLPVDSLAEGTPHDVPVNARACSLVSAGGQPMMLRVSSSGAARWAETEPTIVQPVVQPFTDKAVSPDARFEPASRTAKKLVAIVVANDGHDAIDLAIQVSVARPEAPVVPGPPRLWPNSSAPTPVAAGFVGEPVKVAELSESSGFTLPGGFRIERLPLPEDFLVCALTFWKDKLVVGGYDGEIRVAHDTDGDGLPDRYRHFGGVLDQINNLRAFDGQLYAATPGAVYRIQDGDGDESADTFEVLSSAWDWSGHPFDWFFGLVRDEQGNLYGATTTPHERGDVPGYYMRGSVLKISPDGKTRQVGQGTRYNFGWAQNSAGRRYFNVNQGHWNITCAIHEVVEGAHYGFGEPDLSKVQPPVVRVPYPWCRSLTGMAFADASPSFGPFQHQGFAADYNTRRVIRWTDEPVGAGRQGACFSFLDGLDAGPTELVFGPDGALYVGFMSDVSWYPERARGGIYRVTFSGATPFAVRDCRATPDGFAIQLTGPVDPASILPERSVAVHRYFHEYRGAYHSEEIAHEDVLVRGVELASDGCTLMVRTAPHVTPRIYRLQIRGIRSVTGQSLDNAEMYYTMHTVPR